MRSSIPFLCSLLTITPALLRRRCYYLINGALNKHVTCHMWRLNHYNHFHKILPSILAAEMFHHIPHRYLPQSTHTVTPVNIECVLNVAVCWWGRGHSLRQWGAITWTPALTTSNQSWKWTFTKFEVSQSRRKALVGPGWKCLIVLLHWRQNQDTMLNC